MKSYSAYSLGLMHGLRQCNVERDAFAKAKNEFYEENERLTNILEEYEIKIDQMRKRECELHGECLMLASVIGDAYEIIKNISMNNSENNEKICELLIIMEYALACYDRD